MRNFNQNIATLGVASLNFVELVRLYNNVPPQSNGVVANSNDVIGIATGLEVSYGGDTFIEVNTHKPVVFSTNGFSLVQHQQNFAFVKKSKVKFVTASLPSGDGEALLKSIAQKDNVTASHLNMSALLIHNLKQKGVDVSEYEAKHKALSQRLFNRRNKIIDSGYAKIQEQESVWSNRGKLAGLGALPLIVWGAIILVAGLASGAALKTVFEPDYETSTVDFEISKDLEKALADLSPELRQKILNDIERQIDAAYGRGGSRTNWLNLFGIGLPATLALAVGGIALFKTIK